VFKDDTVKAKLKELGVEYVKVDMTVTSAQLNKDRDRSGRSGLPVNVIYPADYPNSPAILLEEAIYVDDALKALETASK